MALIASEVAGVAGIGLAYSPRDTVWLVWLRLDNGICTALRGHCFHVYRK